MSEKNAPFPLCKLRGSWHDMGYQYGQACKEDIAHMAQWWKDVLVSHHPNLVPEQGLNGAFAMYEPSIKLYAPRWIDFMKGIAEGSGMDYRDILWINVASNLLEAPKWALKAIGGCTTVAVEPERTDIGKTIIGQNLDWHPRLKVVILDMTPDDAPHVLSCTFAGALPQIGISDAKFGAYVNALTVPNNKAGVPMNVICAEALFAPTFSLACERITMCDRAMSFNHMIASQDGSMLDIETTPDDFDFITETNGCLVHANHFQTERLRKDDIFKLAADTIIREHRARKILNTADQIGVETFKKVFRDHHGDINHSICCHPDEKLKWSETWETVLSVISIPEDGVLYATANPCQGEYYEYRLI